MWGGPKEAGGGEKRKINEIDRREKRILNSRLEDDDDDDDEHGQGKPGQSTTSTKRNTRATDFNTAFDGPAGASSFGIQTTRRFHHVAVFTTKEGRACTRQSTQF